MGSCMSLQADVRILSAAHSRDGHERHFRPLGSNNPALPEPVGPTRRMLLGTTFMGRMLLGTAFIRDAKEIPRND